MRNGPAVSSSFKNDVLIDFVLGRKSGLWRQSSFRPGGKLCRVS